MYDIILKNCKIVNENAIYESDVAIKNSRIELIQSSIDQEAKQIIDIKYQYNLYLLATPGLLTFRNLPKINQNNKIKFSYFKFFKLFVLIS